MNEDHHTLTKTHKVENYEDEIELIDILRVIWKWKYVIIAGTLVFVFTAAIISFIALKQQPTMYRTKIVVQPIISKVDWKIDDGGSKLYFDSLETIKSLILDDLKYKVLDGIKSSKKTYLSTSLKFQVDIPKGSNNINVSLESASVEDGTTKLNYLIKALQDSFTNKTKIIQEELKKYIEEKKYEIEMLLLEKKEMKTKITKYEQVLSEIESEMKLFKETRDNSSSKKYILNTLAIENDYRNTFQIYFEENQDAKYNLFKVQKKMNKLSKEIETLEEIKLNVKSINIIQSPVTVELPKSNKIKRNVGLSLAIGLLLMIFFSFLLEYVYKYRRIKINK